MIKDKCPKCGSTDINIEETFGFLACNSCGYGEGFGFDEVAGDDSSSKKGKGKYTPYKRGGSQRSRRK